MIPLEDIDSEHDKQDLFFLVDTSKSMEGSKIDIANSFVKKFISSDYLTQSLSNIDLLINCLIFSNSCRWMSTVPTSIEDFKWNDVLPDNEQPNLGVACFELNEKMSWGKFIHRSIYRPVIILLSDGKTSDDYISGLEQINKNRHFTDAIKLAVAIGEDADKDVLAKFTGNTDRVIPICTTKDLDQLLWIFCFYIGVIYENYSPLMVAVKYGEKEDVVTILESGANVNAINNFMRAYVNGYTPVMYATINNDKELAELLINYGADINMKCTGRHAGQTSLMLAAEHNSKETAELLIQHGADVNVKTEWCGYEDCTALMFAAWYGAKETAELLIKYGADVNAVRKDGRTALMFAVLGNKKEIVKLLIENGADISITDNKGFTALNIAANELYAKESVEIVLEYAKHIKQGK